jgi:hypothetical protein
MAGSLGIHKIHVANSYRNVCPPADLVTRPRPPNFNNGSSTYPARIPSYVDTLLLLIPRSGKHRRFPRNCIISRTLCVPRKHPERGEMPGPFGSSLTLKRHLFPRIRLRIFLPPREEENSPKRAAQGRKVREIRLLSLPRKKRA